MFGHYIKMEIKFLHTEKCLYFSKCEDFQVKIDRFADEDGLPETTEG